MHLTAAVLSLVLALAMLMSGTLKFVRAERIVRLMAAVHVGGPLLSVLGGLQVAGAVGLIAGLGFRPLAIAAAIGLVLYFAGALGAHLRVGDRGFQGAVGFLLVSAATLSLLAVTA